MKDADRHTIAGPKVAEEGQAFGPFCTSPFPVCGKCRSEKPEFENPRI